MAAPLTAVLNCGKSFKMSNNLVLIHLKGLYSISLKHIHVYKMRSTKRYHCHRALLSNFCGQHPKYINVKMHDVNRRYFGTTESPTNVAKEKQEMIQKKKAARREALLQKQKQKETALSNNRWSYDVPTAPGNKKGGPKFTL